MQDEKRYRARARVQVTLSDILSEEGAEEAWNQLIRLGVPPTSLEVLLLSLANQNLPIYPPSLSAKQVRGLSKRLRTDADQISELLQLELFLEGLTNAGDRLPALLKGFANEIERLKFYFPKRRHKPQTWVEMAIVNNIVFATGYDEAKGALAPERVEHHFEAAADLITAAYAAAGLQKVVDARNLARSWYRYSHMRESVGPRSLPK